MIVVTAALCIGMLPEVKDFEVRPVPGEITFKQEKPKSGGNRSVSLTGGFQLRRTFDFIEEGYENLMAWDLNPWKRNKSGFFDHYFNLVSSKDPVDQARVKELQRLAEVWYQRLLLRFPEMAVSIKQVPDDQNGFLKWIEFSERCKLSSKNGEASTLGIPKALTDYLREEGAWDSSVARSWLAENAALLAELRAIGLVPDRSVNGVSIDRWGFIDARLARDCEQALMLESILAAKEGDAATAFESIRAAKGLADHFSQVESPTLLAATVRILLQLDIESRVMNDIIPSLPSGVIDPAEWEAIIKPTVHPPAEFGRLMQGEWSVGIRYYLLPALLDSENPHSAPDAGDLLDDYTMKYAEIVRMHESATIQDLESLKLPAMTVNPDLSRQSRMATEDMFVGAQAWRKGWQRAQLVSALTQAAFAIMKGQPIPQDPVYGQNYQWDPATRQLSMPANQVFEEMHIKPVTVPGL